MHRTTCRRALAALSFGALATSLAVAPARAAGSSANAPAASATPGSASTGVTNLPVSGGWQLFRFLRPGARSKFRVTTTAATWLRVTDTYCAGDRFTVLLDGRTLGLTSAPARTSCGVMTDDPRTAEIGRQWSSGGWVLPPGTHVVTVVASVAPFFSGGGLLRVDAPVLTTSVLRGRKEVPGPGDSDATGHARLELRPAAGEVCREVGVRSVDGVLAGHVHAGSRRVAGPVVVDLGLSGTGTVETFRGCVPADAAVIAAIAYAPWSYYLNVHTRSYPDGALRGQLVPPFGRS